MGDMMVLAFQADLTRVATFMYANEGSTKSYSFIGVPEGHHDLSHHGNDPKKHEKIKKIILLPKEWTVPSGELTPKLSLKRKAILQNNAAAIEKLYAE